MSFGQTLRRYLLSSPKLPATLGGEERREIAIPEMIPTDPDKRFHRLVCGSVDTFLIQFLNQFPFFLGGNWFPGASVLKGRDTAPGRNGSRLTVVQEPFLILQLTDHWFPNNSFSAVGTNGHYCRITIILEVGTCLSGEYVQGFQLPGLLATESLRLLPCVRWTRHRGSSQSSVADGQWWTRLGAKDNVQISAETSVHWPSPS